MGDRLRTVPVFRPPEAEPVRSCIMKRKKEEAALQKSF